MRSLLPSVILILSSILARSSADAAPSDGEGANGVARGFAFSSNTPRTGQLTAAVAAGWIDVHDSPGTSVALPFFDASLVYGLNDWLALRGRSSLVIWGFIIDMTRFGIQASLGNEYFSISPHADVFVGAGTAFLLVNGAGVGVMPGLSFSLGVPRVQLTLSADFPVAGWVGASILVPPAGSGSANGPLGVIASATVEARLGDDVRIFVRAESFSPEPRVASRPRITMIMGGFEL